MSAENTPTTVTRIQMAPVIDGLHEDFTSRSRLPYPFYVDTDGYVRQQDFWQGHVYKVIGFQNDPITQTVNLWWSDVQAPSDTLGKYLVTSNKDGNWSSWPTGVIEAEEVEIYE